MSKLRELNEQPYCGWCSSKVVYKAEWMSECTSCGYKRFINPNPCANIMLVRNKEVLLVRRAIDPQKGQFDIPGGYMDMTDNSIEATALRELKEEIGLTENDILPLRYFSSGKFPAYAWQKTAIHNIIFNFIAELKDSRVILKIDPRENSGSIWVDKESLHTIDFAWNIDKETLSKYFEELA